MSAQLDSVQLNIVTIVDVGKALLMGTLNDNLYMMDNSLSINGQGTAQLSTICKPSQVINWIIYSMDEPTSVRINNITFVDREVCTKLRIYGSPVMKLSPYTPVYAYWAGMVLSNLPVGMYRYRLELELGKLTKSIMYTDTPSLNVISLARRTDRPRS